MVNNLYSKEGNEFVGSFAVIPVKNSNDIQLGYALLQPFWGLGYASESVKGGIQYAFAHLDLENIAGITEAENIASQKVLTRNGFVFEKSFTEDNKLLHIYRLWRPASFNG
jgi:[ribosomal protein S5]-alanine N-acetyltransferase